MAGLILFTTSTCVHCGPIKQMLEKLKTQYEDEPYEFVTMVVDQDAASRDYAINWAVQAVPTIIFFQDAQEVHRMVGGITQTALEEHVERYLQRDVLSQSPGGIGDSSGSVLCGIGEQEVDGARSS